MKRLLVNDQLTAIPGTRTFWHDLQEWFDMEFVGAPFNQLATVANDNATKHNASLIIRNATWFEPLEASKHCPTISLLQDIFTEGPQRKMQEEVMHFSRAVIFNSAFTASKYQLERGQHDKRVIPLPVDFTLFEPGNAMGLQQALSLPDGCVCWIGASREAAHIKGYDIFLQIVRQNPDINFVAVFKDATPDYCPPNMRMFVKLTHEELVKVIGACRVGLCTSRVESQHLAGIEMGACGLPVVASPIGVYYGKTDGPGILWTTLKFPLEDNSPVQAFSSGIRVMLNESCAPQEVRKYWKRDFDKPIIKAAWERLVEEVEHEPSNSS